MPNFKVRISFFLFALCFSSSIFSQNVTALVNQVKAKLEQVNNYTATGKMKTDVAFIKAPISNIKVYYKKPDHFRIQKNGGISILPKGGVSVNMNSLLTMKDFTAIAAGESKVNGVNTTVVKLLPLAENSEVVLTTLYIDVAALLVRKAITTTKDNGTFQIDLSYGKYSSYGLPDKVIFSFDTKDYKMPKAVTLDMDKDPNAAALEKLKGKKGKIEITYNAYTINKGVPDNVFE